jgi:hypothetical protein
MDDQPVPDLPPVSPTEATALGGSTEGAPGGDGPRAADEAPPRRPGRARRWMIPGAALLVVAALLLFTDVPAGTVIGSVVLSLVILRVGWFFLQQFATPPPPPPDPGTLRRVRLVYRCPNCGAEVRMTSAATEDPEPPRHCMEDMELISTADDAL